MSFGAMSAGGALALAGVTATIVIVLFFLKLRHRRYLVGSSFLWNRVLMEQSTSSLLEKLRRILSLLLTLAIALLIALAIARPAMDSGGAGIRPLVIVLDTSPSMETRGPDGTTRWTLATSRAVGLLPAALPEAGVMVTDTAGRVHTLLTRDRAALIEALGGMRPFPGPQHFPALAGSDAADVFFITDGVNPMAVPDGVREVRVFEPAENVAVTAFDVRVDPTSPSGYRAFLEVTNFGTQAREVAVLLSGAGDQRQGWRLDLGAGESWQEDLDLGQFPGGGLRLRVEAEGDGLSLDDTAYAYLPPADSLRVVLVTEDSESYLKTLLDLSPRVELSVISPSEYADDPRVDVYVFAGFAPETPPREPAIVFGAATGWLAASGGVANDQTITSWDAAHPVMQHVPLHDVAVERARVIDPGDTRVLAASEATPLIVVDEAPVRRVLVGFGVEDSDFPLHLGFPIFIENALSWCSGEGLAETAGLGDVRIAADAAPVTTLEGDTVPATLEFGSTVIEALEPELLTAIVEGRRVRVAANLLDRSVSDVNRSRPAESEADSGPVAIPSELWVAMLLVAALLMAMEWWTWNRRVTV